MNAVGSVAPVSCRAFHFDLPGEEAGRRELRHHRGVRHARDGLDAPRQLLEERGDRRPVGYFCCGSVSRIVRTPLGSNPRSGALHLEKAAHQQSGAEQQNDRQRDLGDDQPLAELRGGAALPAAAIGLE